MSRSGLLSARCRWDVGDGEPACTDESRCCDADQVSDWGRATFDDPCRECGYRWPDDLEEIRNVVRRTPDAMALALAGSNGTARHRENAWDGRSYICHVADNLRIWAERLVAAVAVADQPLRPYDADALARARVYEALPVAGALWSLSIAVDAWFDAVRLAQIDGDISLLHPERGRLRLSDVMSTNAHDAYHHVFDVRRAVGGSPAREADAGL